MCTARLPVVYWTDAPADLNGLVRCAERRNLVSARVPSRFKRSLHTCNVIAYRKAVTLQVTDTVRSYEMNFHPVPHDVTVACERYTVGFPVCCGSPSDVFAASSGFLHLYTLRLKKRERERKERRWWQRQPCSSREVYSGSSLLADLNFQSVSRLY
jgi:hypothetical protein